MKRIELLEKIFDDKTVKILRELITVSDIFYLRDVSKRTGVSLATTYRIMQRLVNLGMVEKEKVGKFIQYRIKKGEKYNEVYALISGEEVDPIKLFKTKIENKYGSSFTIFNTQDKKLFLIGKDIGDISDISKDIERSTGVRLSILKVDPEQFKRMKEMGLIKDGTYL
ncbi:MAG: winged helix-turn-helix transcriptional regulator [Candidatus Woesearchaeota archaeon]|nr:MAG: winged helix-turn-helix transcriptional regulator [Candidatus Woesearchaeota archaeon]